MPQVRAALEGPAAVTCLAELGVWLCWGVPGLLAVSAGAWWLEDRGIWPVGHK